MFFKPILPGFKNGLNIPIDFLKYLNGYDDIEHAVLKRAGGEWQVKVNFHRFEEGWKEFAEEHDLQLGDLLIFRRDGNMDFEVTTIFDSIHCEREYADFFQQEGKNVEEEEEEDEEDEDEADEEKENEEDEEEEDKEDDEEEDEEEAHIVEENSKDFEFKGEFI
ncbi:putative B3 domain-containing protein REM14-like isoform X1 [Capsicum annuum]|nr:putative B3 domain-containing protein REM14-like isoform X1 [Capsicum annuum]